MTETRANRISLWVPLVCSGLAFALVMANILARVPPQPDETTSAHLWQMLMLAQLPFIAMFLFTTNWRRWKRPLAMVAFQCGAFALAAVPVWLAGY